MPRARDWLLVPLWVVVAAIGILWGGHNVLRTLRNWSPRAITCADYVADRPDAEWVRLEQCVPDLGRLGVERSTQTRDGAPMSSTTEITGVIVPLRPVGAPDDARVGVVLEIDHGPLLALGADDPSDAVTRRAAEELAGPLDGLVEGVIDRSATSREELRALHLGLAQDFAIVTYHARPRPLWLSGGVLAIGLGAASLVARTWRRRRRAVELARATVLRG